MSERYDADYFLRGQELGISGYTDYRWMPDLTIPMVTALVSHLGIQPNDTILDFGCARGYTVRAFRELGYSAWGYDISKWAVENADHHAREYILTEPQWRANLALFNWVIAKDVLEHVENLCETIDRLMDKTRTGVFAVVPLSHDGKTYDVPSYDEDVTHIHRRPLLWWVGHFHRAGWSVNARYRMPGVKDNYAQYTTGNGFITARRLK